MKVVMKRGIIGFATTMLVCGGLGLTSGTAQAEPGFGPAPLYHWCPGEFWRPEWGFNFDWNACHDDHHRDGDDDNHNNASRRQAAADRTRAPLARPRCPDLVGGSCAPPPWAV